MATKESTQTLLDPNQHYEVWGHRGIAFYFAEDERQPDEDTIWTGIEEMTGNVLMVMVGDDRAHSVDPDDCTPLEPTAFCRDCGQIGCGCNVYE